MKNPLILALFLSSFLFSCSTSAVTPAQPVKIPSKVETTCPAVGQFQAVDLSQPVTPRFLEMMRYLKVETVCRYYDWEQETIRNKTLTKPELELIHGAGLKACVVFQHNNSKLASFTSARGEIDAKRSLELAGKLGQPKGSVIFFGVDFDAYRDSDQVMVKSYFLKAAPMIRAAGYLIGAYGSGKTLDALFKAGLIDRKWLSMSTGFAGSKNYDTWDMKQTLDRNCGGINVDFNYTDRKGAGGF